jgi:hypothetical protein
MNKTILGLALILAFIISFLHIFLCIDAYTDIAAWYGPLAKAASEGDWQTALAPQVPVLNLVFAGVISGWTGMHPFTGLLFVSCFFYIVSIPVLYYLLKHFLKRGDYAAWGCLMFALAPKIIRFSCTGLLTSSRNFFLIAATAIVVSAIEKTKLWQPLLLGICLAGLALARAEAVIFAPLLTLWYGYYIYKRLFAENRQKCIVKILTHWVVIVIIFFVCISPRLYQMHNTTGVPVLDIRQALILSNFVNLEFKNTPDVMLRALQSGSGHEVVKTKFDKIWQGVECFVRGAYVPYLLLALIGLFLWWRKEKILPDTAMLISIILVNLMAFLFISNSVRYYTLNLIMLLPFSFVGLKFLWDKLHGKWFKIAAALIIAVIAVGQVINGSAKIISRKYDYEYKTGIWIKNGIKQGKKIILASDKPQYAMWAGAIWMESPENSKFLPQSFNMIKTVDIIVYRKDNIGAVNFFAGRSEFKQIKHPQENKTVIWVRKQ